MGITFLVPPPPLPALGSGLDCFSCSIPLTAVNFATPVPTPIDSFHQLTALLSFLPGVSDRARLRTLTFAASAHHHRAAMAAQNGVAVQASLDEAPPGFGTAAIALPPPADLPRPAAASEALRALRSSHHQISTVVAVAAEPRAWKTHGLEVDGWAQADVGQEGSTAEAVFAILCTLMSEDTLTCLDEGSVADAFGPFAQPARIANLLWLAGEQRLVWLRSADRDRVSRADSAIAFPLTTAPSLASGTKICASLRTVLPARATLSISLATSLPALPMSSARAYAVPVLYR
jgi:hypothetical protein